MVPKISVVMTLYNGEKWIAATLRSLQAQTYRDFEAVLLDDGSTDGTARAVRPFLEDKRLRFVEKDHEGIPKTRNKALALARGKFLAFLDQDDLFAPRKLEAQACALERSPDVGAVYCRLRFISATGWRLPFIRYPAPEPRDGFILETILRSWYRPLLISIMTRRDAAETVGAFDESLWGADDFDWVLRLAAKSRLAFMSETLADYRLRSGSASHREEMLLDVFVFIKKIKERWPEHAALVARHEEGAHLMYAKFLIANGRAAEAAPHLQAAGTAPDALKPGLLGALKNAAWW